MISKVNHSFCPFRAATDYGSGRSTRRYSCFSWVLRPLAQFSLWTLVFPFKPCSTSSELKWMGHGTLTHLILGGLSQVQLYGAARRTYSQRMVSGLYLPQPRVAHLQVLRRRPRRLLPLPHDVLPPDLHGKFAMTAIVGDTSL